MAKVKCKAKELGLVTRRGKASIEFEIDNKPQYYCYGYIDAANDELLPVCKMCRDNVIYAQKDLEKILEEAKNDLGS